MLGVWFLKGRISCELFGPTMNHNTLWTVGSDWHVAQGWNAILEVTESWGQNLPQNVWIWVCLKIRFTTNLLILHIVSYFFQMILGGNRVLGLQLLPRNKALRPTTTDCPHVSQKGQEWSKGLWWNLYVRKFQVYSLQVLTLWWTNIAMENHHV